MGKDASNYATTVYEPAKQDPSAVDTNQAQFEIDYDTDRRRAQTAAVQPRGISLGQRWRQWSLLGPPDLRIREPSNNHQKPSAEGH